MSRQIAHIISHSHWDREWYLPFEKHRYYLVKLMDDLLEKLANDPAYKSFHLDGQTIAIDDYLEIRPDQREIIEKYIQDHRIHIGPWYILQDAFLTSAEANVRNLQIGMYEANRFGKCSKLGYFPDTFGIYGQAPQLLRQAGISAATFGRGVKPTGFNNMVSDHATFESPYSELKWESPDGSNVLGILLANWYSNGNEIPRAETEAKPFWDQKLMESKKYASTPHLLYMNGCDHQPLQKDITEAIQTAQELYPEVEFVHSDFDTYIQAVQHDLPDDLQVIEGELRSQKTDGWSTLVNTASSRIYIKQMNHSNQMKLERLAEPVATFAYLLGEEYPEDYLQYAWKQLMKNHAHDSICGCSVDEVHEEMVTRFEKVDQMTDMIIAEQIGRIVDKMDMKAPAGFDVIHPLVVLNTNGNSRSAVIDKVVDYQRIYFREQDYLEIPDELMILDFNSLAIIDSAGNIIPAEIADMGVEFDYDLPDDQFRQPYYARRLKVSFQTVNLPAFGYQTYFLVKGTKLPENLPTFMPTNRTMENAYIKVFVHDNGTYDVEHKETGKKYRQLGAYENTSDIGNEYMFKKGQDEKAYHTKDLQAHIEIIENNAVRATMEITHHFEIPRKAGSELADQKHRLIWHRDREAGRSRQMTTLTIVTTLTIDRETKGLAVKLSVNNTAKDHRLRVLFPTGLQTNHHLAESAFEIVKRPNEPEQGWENPSFDHHQQSFASLSDGNHGLTVATKGLHEYEVIKDETTLAVTVLRAVSELGDWGYFPTPGAQCQGTQTAEWMIIPHQGDAITARVYEQAYHFQVPVICEQAIMKNGSIAQEGSFINWQSNGLVFTSLKKGQQQNNILMRMYNPANEQKQLTIHSDYVQTYGVSNILEDQPEAYGSDYMNQQIKPYKIVTVSMEVKEE